MGARLKREREKYADYDELKAAAAKAADSEGARKRELEEARAEVLNDDETVPGSSPRVRGAHLNDTLEIDEVGIIPAGAGSTTPRCLPTPSASDHPRGCGEHCLCSRRSYAPPGSSPHMRGARRRPRADRPQHRIIPAHAGSTLNSPR